MKGNLLLANRNFVPMNRNLILSMKPVESGALKTNLGVLHSLLADITKPKQSTTYKKKRTIRL